ncbi:MAG: AI-2E family transporter [Sandarakinorhabdus sp.]|nr:AI-2E family transporter [Sandarakinorhabdus sp.]
MTDRRPDGPIDPSPSDLDPKDLDPRGLSIADRLSLPRIHWGWLLLIAGFGVLFWTARGVLGPFVAGFIVAYLLDPMTQRLERRGLPRWLAAIAVLLLFFLAIFAILLAAAPIVQAQVYQLTTSLPQLIDSTLPIAERLLKNTRMLGNSQEIISNLGNKVIEWFSNSITTIVAGGLAFVNLISFIVVTPIVAFYLLRDWPIIVMRIESWWPRKQLPVIKGLLGEANESLSGFVRGQSLVCLTLAVFYALGWSLVGLDYAITLGLLAGVLGFVPFLGVIFAVVLSLLIALGQWGLDPFHLGLVIGVFLVGQALESSVLTPNLIGNRIGLHPVWVLFAVFAGGTIAGVVGVFFAVPVAAVLGVIVRHALAHYRQSNFYDPPLP